MQANYNYTNKQEIKKQNFKIDFLNAGDSTVREVMVRLKKTFKVSNKEKIIIEFSGRSNYERKELENTTDKQTFKLENFGLEEKIESGYRLFLVATDKVKKGLILLSSKQANQKRKKRKKNADGKNFEKVNIFNPEYVDDIGEQIWTISWQGHEPTIKINIRLKAIYKDDLNDPVFSALVLPNILKAILTESLLRFDNYSDVEGQVVDDWFLWAKNFDEIPEDRSFNNGEWLEWVDKVVEEFCDKRFENHNTLLEKLEGAVNG